MAFKYNKFFILLINREISQPDFRKMADLAPNTMTKLRRNEPVALTVLDRICETLKVDYGDIIEHIPDGEGERH